MTPITQPQDPEQGRPGHAADDSRRRRSQAHDDHEDDDGDPLAQPEPWPGDRYETRCGRRSTQVSARLRTVDLVSLNAAVEMKGLTPARAAVRWWDGA